MRIRQVRPEFFTDAVTSRLQASVRLTYIGLWCVADDAGWMTWDVPQIAAQLYPYESVRVRERRVASAGEALVEAGRLVMHPCGCALIPKLADHQRIGGNKSFPARDKHEVHTRPDKSARNVRVGNGTVSEGRLEARERAKDDDDRAATLAAFRRQGLPVDVAS
jgi:hypothetical protein